MKYLYKILRLFFCPHKYVEVSRNEKRVLIPSHGRWTRVGEVIEKECKYCGRTKTFHKDL